MRRLAVIVVAGMALALTGCQTPSAKRAAAEQAAADLALAERMERAIDAAAGTPHSGPTVESLTTNICGAQSTRMLSPSLTPLHKRGPREVILPLRYGSSGCVAASAHASSPAIEIIADTM